MVGVVLVVSSVLLSFELVGLCQAQDPLPGCSGSGSPYPFNNGESCCGTDTELNDTTIDPFCDGGQLFLDSPCCIADPVPCQADEDDFISCRDCVFVGEVYIAKTEEDTLDNFTGTTIIECANFCRRDPRCYAFSHNRALNLTRNGLCNLFTNNVNSTRRMGTWSFMLNCTQCDMYQLGFQPLTEEDRLQVVSNVNSKEACRELCIKTVACEAHSFNFRLGICELFGNVTDRREFRCDTVSRLLSCDQEMIEPATTYRESTTPRTTVTLPQTTSACDKTKDCHVRASDYQVTYGSRYHLVFNIGSLTECRLVCHYTKDCLAISYSHALRFCATFTTIDTFKPQPGVVSQRLDCPCN